MLVNNILASFLFTNYYNMATTNFRKLLDTSINQIDRRLKEKYEDTLKETALKYFDNEKYNSIWQQIIDLNNQIDELKTEVRRLESQKESFKPKLSFEWEEWMKNNWYSSYFRKEDESTYQARRELHNEPVYKNIEEFRKLSMKFINAIWLAVWSKDQRNVLLSFYNLDWKSLGIDIPPSMDFGLCEVKDWKIISDTKLLSN